MILYAYIVQKLREREEKEAGFAQEADMSYEKYDVWNSEHWEKVRWFNRWTEVYSQVLVIV
jgi:hypothetical protein